MCLQDVLDFGRTVITVGEFEHGSCSCCMRRCHGCSCQLIVAVGQILPGSAVYIDSGSNQIHGASVITAVPPAFVGVDCTDHDALFQIAGSNICNILSIVAGHDYHSSAAADCVIDSQPDGLASHGQSVAETHIND